MAKLAYYFNTCSIIRRQTLRRNFLRLPRLPYTLLGFNVRIVKNLA
nr:MAG TPA: hypothetical protein [Caudoviricetes sp.]